jgi:hypothetical protein
LFLIKNALFPSTAPRLIKRMRTRKKKALLSWVFLPPCSTKENHKPYAGCCSTMDVDKRLGGSSARTEWGELYKARWL